jgi:hypothetical protein
MQTERIPVVSSDLGGYDARKVWFRTDTAAVILKRVPVKLVESVPREERRFRLEALRSLHGGGRRGACAGAAS